MPTIAEIREKCPDVSIRRNEVTGKTTCRFYSDGMCVAAGHDGADCVIFPRQQGLGLGAVVPAPAPAPGVVEPAPEPEPDGIAPIEVPVEPTSSSAPLPYSPTISIAVDPSTVAGLVRDPRRKVYAQTSLDAERGGLDVSDMIWSHSRLQAWQKCPRAFMYQYLMGLGQTTQPKWSVEGSAFHSALETLYNTDGQSLMVPATGIEGSDAKLFGLLKGLHDIGQISLANTSGVGWDVERTVNFALDGIQWTVRFDLLSKDAKILVDHKTTGADVEHMGLLDVLYQMALYNAAVPTAEETWIDVFRKPELRLSKGESPEAFTQRVARDVAKRPGYYHRVIRFYRAEINVDRYVSQMCEGVRLAIESVHRGVFPRHRRHCSGAGSQCAYEALCIAEI